VPRRHLFRGRGARPQTEVIVACIDAYKGAFGVEPICRVLRHHHVTIAPSTYYAFKNRPPSARKQSDERLLPVIRQVYVANFECYGIRKVWQALRHLEITVGRHQVARLMRTASLQGKRRQRRIRTTFPDPWAVRSADLVRREWSREAPERV
jgi:putative transposase